VAKKLADDWFRITLVSEQSVLASLSYDKNRAWLTMELYVGSQPNPVTTTSVGYSTPVAYFNSGTSPQDLYLHIFIPGGFGVLTDYQLALAPVPVPTNIGTDAAQSITYGNGTANGHVNPNGYSPTTWFEYGTDPTFGAYAETTHQLQYGFAGASMNFSDRLQHLTPTTTYYYRVVASTAGGIVRGTILSFTTLAYPTPSNPNPADGGIGSIANWYISVEGGGDSYDLYLGTDSQPPLFSSGPLSDATSRVYATVGNPTGLTPNTIYHWRIVTHYLGLSASTPVYSFTTPAAAAGSPNPGDFGPVIVGTTRLIPLSVVVNYNAFATFSVTGEGFALVSPSTSTWCGNGCQVKLSFAPTSTGQQNGALLVSTNGSGLAATTAIPLLGRGVNIELFRPSRPSRSGTTTVVAGQSRQVDFSIGVAGVPGPVHISCEVIPALADCEVSNASVSGAGSHDLSVTLHTSRRRPQKMRAIGEDPDAAELGTPPGAYTVRVTAAFAGVTRTIDFPLQVR